MESQFTYYRVMLAAEDGVYCQEDSFKSFRLAAKWIEKNANPGEGQQYFIQQYNPYEGGL